MDFEDVYLAAVGREVGAAIVVTQNEKDFASAPWLPTPPRRSFQ